MENLGPFLSASASVAAQLRAQRENLAAIAHRMSGPQGSTRFRSKSAVLDCFQRALSSCC